MTSSERRYNLTEGSILQKILLVALPIIGSQFMQMTYNLTDMFWLGRLSSDAVAASGTAGFYLWLSQAFLIIARMGAEIGVAQHIGRGDRKEAEKYCQNALLIAVSAGILYGVSLLVFRTPLIGFFAIQEADVAADAASYLSIIAIGIPMSFTTAAVTGTFNASGNSRIPFYINATGLVVNMVLDPLFIFGMNGGIQGAAAATVIGQSVVCLLSLAALLFHRERPFEKFRLSLSPDRRTIMQILRWCIPIGIESMLFTLLSMVIARFVSGWGSSAIAAQRIGSQIESLSWLLGASLASALTAFTGQNFGAQKWPRIREGYRITVVISFVWGCIVSFVMFFLGGALYRVFVSEPDVILFGIQYMRILALCQIAGNLENVAAGAFRGMGKTLPPTIVSVSCNALRILLCCLLSRTALGLDGIWIGLTLGAVLRGFGIFIWYAIFSRRHRRDPHFENHANFLG